MYELLPQLGRAYAKEGKGKQVAILLQQLIVAHADDLTLERILDEVRQEVIEVTSAISTG